MFGAKYCPAFGKQCVACGGRNYFASICRSRQKKRQPRQTKLHYVEAETDDENDSSVNESLITLTLTPRDAIHLGHFSLTQVPRANRKMLSTGKESEKWRCV